MTLLFKYRCGCIGFRETTLSEKHLIVEACDREDRGIPGLSYRKLTDPGQGEPLKEEEEKEIFTNINFFINCGCKYLEVKTLLK